MPRQKLLIPESPIVRMFKDLDNIRVSQNAMEYLAGFLLKEAQKVSIKAGEIAKHRSSRTINKGDITLAIK
jgi:histone H3/H4